jgi:hypothetical protein
MDAHHEINRRKTVVKRAIVVAISVILALTMAAPTVLARSVNGVPPEDVNPDSEPIFINAGDNTLLGGSCAFDMRLDLSGKAKTIELPNGAFVFTSPGLDATITNLENGEQATFNITGAFHQTTAENGDVTFRITGRNLPFDPDEGVNLTIGNFSFVFDENGTLIKSFADPPVGNGQVIDVCALLS